MVRACEGFFLSGIVVGGLEELFATREQRLYGGIVLFCLAAVVLLVLYERHKRG